MIFPIILSTIFIASTKITESFVHPPLSFSEPKLPRVEPSIQSDVHISFSTQDLKIPISQEGNVTANLVIRGTLLECINITFTYDPPDPTIEPLEDLYVCPPPNKTQQHEITNQFTFQDTGGWLEHRNNPLKKLENINSLSAYRKENVPLPLSQEEVMIQEITLIISAQRVGQTIVMLETSDENIDVSRIFMRVAVILDPALDIVSIVFGWIYTISWDISFLPQVILNFRRRSVVGLSLDYVVLNDVGYFCYSAFNIGFYFIPYIQNQFAARHPTAVNHVRLNDLGFSCYALIVQTIITIQCIVYERAKNQKVSISCQIIVGISTLVTVVGIILALTNVIWWLDVLYALSFLKLIIDAFKYIPQLWVNYKQKGTGGVSKLGMQLDLLGGAMSLAQMFCLAANNDDWLSLFTDFTKFGLGSLTVLFDTLFFIQHYCIYRNYGEKQKRKSSVDSKSSST